MPTKILVTGGAGFAGSHLIEEILRGTDWEVFSLDRLTYAGDLDRLAHLAQTRIRCIHHDFRMPLGNGVLKQLDGVRFIVHNGAETHVRRSFANPEIFVQSNVTGTLNMLEAARVLSPEMFLYTSTDEVFGPVSDERKFEEDDALLPSNPYSASKAAGEMLVRSYWRSFQLPVIITRTMNMFGERQHPEKFVPMVIRKLLSSEPVEIHTSPGGQIGSRQWLHARVQASAILFLLQGAGKPGEIYHVSGEKHSNLEIAQIIADILEVGMLPWFVNAFSEFPAHDLHYAIDGTKILRLRWNPPVDFLSSLSKTVLWSKEHREWLCE